MARGSFMRRIKALFEEVRVSEHLQGHWISAQKWTAVLNHHLSQQPDSIEIKLQDIIIIIIILNNNQCSIFIFFLYIYHVL